MANHRRSVCHAHGQVSGWLPGSATIAFQDNDRLQFVVAIPQQISEAAGVISNRCVVQISGTLESNLVVSLHTSNPSVLNAPSSVTIPAGQTWAGFNVTPANDSQVNAPRPVTVTAQAPGWIDGTGTVTVVDDETPEEPFRAEPVEPCRQPTVEPAALMEIRSCNLIANGDFDCETSPAGPRKASPTIRMAAVLSSAL